MLKAATLWWIAVVAELFLFASNTLGQERPQLDLALGKPVLSSGPTWGNLVPASLTDGDPNTFAHPLASSGTLEYYFEVDLGGRYELNRILLRNRADGCCPERLTDYRVEIYADNGGDAGVLNWSATMRADGSNCGVAGVDTITRANNPGGTFAGRFVRIVNNSGAAYNPQIAEVEVYGALTPRIDLFAADDDTISAGETATLRWQITRATGAAISPGIGSVSATNGLITVRPGVTTTYTLTATNEAGSSSADASVGVDVTLAPPQISEFLADNKGILKDVDGDSSDWIELKNPNPFRLGMAGYHLTGDPTLPFQWPFPAVRIPANGFLIVFASGKDRRDPSAELHANFRLEAKGDYLALADGAGRILQQFPTNYPLASKFPAQIKNVSYGIGSNGVGFLRPPTPGAENDAAFAGVVADTKFSADRGFYSTNFAVAITCATPDAIIRYTTNRSEPTATQGFLYSAPITISQTTILRAAAFKSGWAPTDVDTHTYLFLSNVVSSSVMNTNITRNPSYATQVRAGLVDVPSISLTTTGTVNGATEVKTSIEWLRPDGQPGFHEDCGIKEYGGVFTDFAKKSFRLYFRSDYGAPKLKYPVFEGYDRGLAPVDEFNQLELRSGSHDMSQRGFYLSNIFTDDTLLDMGQLNPHGRFVHLYFNGAYWGLYHLRERWDAAMHQSYLGGARTNYESINGNWNVGGWAEPGSPYDGDGSVWEEIKSLRGNYAAVKPLLDAAEYVDYMVMWMFGGAEDEYRCVGPNISGSGFKFYLNDADGWFCGPYYCAAGDRTARGSPGRLPGDGPGSLFSMLFKEGHPDYRTLLADRIYQALLNEGALTPQQNSARLITRCNEIERAFIAESARWNYLTPAEWAGRRDNALTNWLPGRTVAALAEYRNAGFYPSLDAPVLNQQGGAVPSGFQLQFALPTRGAIHFTLDGSDPRLPGGAVSPTAQTFSAAGLTETVVPAGARWRWFTDGTGLGSSDLVVGNPNWSSANWKHPAFDDSGWSEGPAQLGYGEGDEATVIPFGPDPNKKWTTAYFRHRFNLADNSDITGVRMRLKRDDGAIVYLNGREAARSTIATGPVNASTFADPASDDGQTFSDFTLTPDLLLQGDNLVAVELHQATFNTSDASFDLELNVSRPSPDNSSNALPVISRNTLLKSRAKDGAEWSALNEAFFQVGPAPVEPGEVAVSELNYDPARTGAEFVELANLSSRAVNLRGIRFLDGIAYSFAEHRDTLLAPGQRLVLVKDLLRFQRQYGINVPVAGIYSGSLDKDGERITLASSSSNILSSFTYGTSQPWPANDPNKPCTLVLSHPELGLDNPAAWRASADTKGSPGGTDSTSFQGIPTADLDGDGLPAVLEYALGTSDTDPSSGPGALAANVDASGNFTITFPRNLQADEVTLLAEASEDLFTWSRAALLASENSGAGIARETWGVQAAGKPAVFLRLRVVLPY